ncbi:polyphosphate polymerase domain-containing protein [Actinoplanes hulinensis]|uniref:Polyphosphate polymerase domain-containing protein n=1 Tax=Actinoplanes hulinensis TaxID=1144547 RepID=A0ABS7B7F0_9ACTN|nr:polyphosphate polymerase domain-containing protein [Actinoplanes hulinensis]MBW6436946.1 polyphosphate polymerase domain-containing protein [Actinoplanes hulinensis]
MTAAVAFDTLGALPAVSLAEMDQRAALQCRFDRKYLLPAGDARRLLAELAPAARVLEIDGIRHFTYESLYLDTPGLVSYLRTAYRHRRRFKIRTRTYVDSGSCWLEAKVPGPRGSTVKYRAPHVPGQPHPTETGLAFLDEIFARHGLSPADRAGLTPVLRTAYLRFALLMPGDSRVTVDTDLRWIADGRELRLPGVAIVETKTVSTAAEADRLLWRRGHRPVAISKYATGLAALRTDLPAAPWRRVLRQHFTLSREDLLHG